MLKCEEFVEKVSDYIDGHLPGGERASIWMHKAMCGHCRRYLNQIKAVISLTQSMDRELPAEEPCPEAMQQQLAAAFRAKRDPDH